MLTLVFFERRRFSNGVVDGSLHANALSLAVGLHLALHVRVRVQLKNKRTRVRVQAKKNNKRARECVELKEREYQNVSLIPTPYSFNRILTFSYCLFSNVRDTVFW